MWILDNRVKFLGAWGQVDPNVCKLHVISRFCTCDFSVLYVWFLGIWHVHHAGKKHVHSRQTTCDTWWCWNLKILDFFCETKSGDWDFLNFLGASTNRTLSLQIALTSRQIAFISRVQKPKKFSGLLSHVLNWLHWRCCGTSLQRPKLWHDGWVLQPAHGLGLWFQEFNRSGIQGVESDAAKRG